MSLIIIICAVALELFYESVDRFKKYNWFPKYRDWIISLFRDSKIWQGPVGVLSVVGGPFLILFVTQSILASAGGLSVIFYFLVAVLVLVYSLRFHALEYLIDQVAMHRGTKTDKEQISLRAVQGLVNDNDAANQHTNTILVNAVLIQANERLFAVLFWFLILGPAGALLYRMAAMLATKSIKGTETTAGDNAQLARDDFVGNAQRLFGVLSWIPARIVALGYALAGGFEDAIHNWREIDKSKNSKTKQSDFMFMNREILLQTGSGAMQLHRYYTHDEPGTTEKKLTFEGVKAAQGLIMRTLLILMVVVILVVLAS